MRPHVWRPSIALSTAEAAIVRRVRRAKLFVFLREHRRALFDDAFQAELAQIYANTSKGQPPVPPAQLALVTIVQAYTGASDDEAIEALTMDRRWQLVADCLDCVEPPFSKGTLVAFRRRLIAHDLDRRLVERTVELAEQTAGFGSRALRAALDSSPLWGAGRVEDTYNLMGHALIKALGVIARQQGRGLAELATEAGATVLVGTSLKASLDLDWDDPVARAGGLSRLLDALDAVASYVDDEVNGATAARAAVEVAELVRDQDVEITADGAPRLRCGVARDRRISVEDPEMRHGRKSRSQRVDGYKRHALRDLDLGVVRAVALTAANEPEAAATTSVVADLAHQRAVLSELHIDRGYLASALVRDRPPDLTIFCKAWPVRNGDRFPKTAFTLDWDSRTIRCPANQTLPFETGGTVHFPAQACTACSLRARCTTSPHGRGVAIHPDEQLLVELRERQTTSNGRAILRQRVAVEHSLAHLGRWQGRRARYRGHRKNLLDLRRATVVHNLHAIARFDDARFPQVA